MQLSTISAKLYYLTHSMASGDAPDLAFGHLALNVTARSHTFQDRRGSGDVLRIA